MRLYTLFLTLTTFIFADNLYDKEYYRAFPYFYYENGLALEEGDQYYSMKQINENKHLKNRMGFCITEFEIYNIVHMGCVETFNTLEYYITKPKGLLRKDILEFYHDMPLENYEKSLHVKKAQHIKVKRYKDRNSEHIWLQSIKNIQNKVLADMEEELYKSK